MMPCFGSVTLPRPPQSKAASWEAALLSIFEHRSFPDRHLSFRRRSPHRAFDQEVEIPLIIEVADISRHVKSPFWSSCRCNSRL